MQIGDYISKICFITYNDITNNLKNYCNFAPDYEKHDTKLNSISL